MKPLREQLLRIGTRPTRPGEAIQSQAGLDLSYANVNRFPEVCARVVCELGKLARHFNPDVIVPVPDHATGYGRAVGISKGIGSICLGRDPSTGQPYFRGASQASFERHQRAVIIDDVLHEDTNYEDILSLPGMSERAVAVVSIWNRCNSEGTLQIPEGLAVVSLINEPITETGSSIESSVA